MKNASSGAATPCKCLLLGTLAIGVLAGGATAQQPAAPERLSLSSAVDLALRERPLLGADSERISAERARVTQARAALRPRVDLQANASEGLPGAPQIFIGGLAGSPFKKYVGASVTLVQTLLDFGRTRSTVLSRRANVAASEELLQADSNRVTLEVQRAYLQALQARRLVEVNRQILEQRRLAARQARTLLENGMASRVDVDLVELNVSQAELAVVRAQNEVETAFAGLGAAVGRPVTPTTILEEVIPESSPDNAPPAPTATPLEGVLAAALRNRPELRQAEAQALSFDHQADVARASKRPLLNFIGSVGKVNPGPLIEDSDKPYAVSLVLTAPLFTGGLLEAQVEEARRNAAAARGNRSELENQVRQQVISTLANLRAAEESIRVARAQQTTAQDALSLATQRYQAQLGSIVELSQAQVAFAVAQNDLIRAQYDRELARAALDFATGSSFGKASKP